MFLIFASKRFLTHRKWRKGGSKLTVQILRGKGKKKSHGKKEKKEEEIQEYKGEIEAFAENLQKEIYVDEPESAIPVTEEQAWEDLCVAQSLLIDGK